MIDAYGSDMTYILIQRKITCKIENCTYCTKFEPCKLFHQGLNFAILDKFYRKKVVYHLAFKVLRKLSSTSPIWTHSYGNISDRYTRTSAKKKGDQFLDVMYRL